jgi:hypothetical protein
VSFVQDYVELHDLLAVTTDDMTAVEGDIHAQRLPEHARPQ